MSFASRSRAFCHVRGSTQSSASTVTPALSPTRRRARSRSVYARVSASSGVASRWSESGVSWTPLAGAGLFTAVGGPAVALQDAVTFVLAAAALSRLMRRSSLTYTGADFVVRPDGRWVFLANSGPQFGWLESATGADMTGAMARLLMRGLT